MLFFLTPLLRNYCFFGVSPIWPTPHRGEGLIQSISFSKIMRQRGIKIPPLLCVVLRSHKGKCPKGEGLNSIIKGKKSTYKVKKWQGFSDNHTSSSPTHPTRAYEYFHRGKKYPPPRTTSYEDDRHAPNPLSSYDYDKAFR